MAQWLRGAWRKQDGANRRTRRFVRTRVSPIERATSFLLLASLLGIGVAVGVKGRHFDPARFSLPAEALAATSAATSTDADEGEKPAETATEEANSPPETVTDAAYVGGHDASSPESSVDSPMSAEEARAAYSIAAPFASLAVDGLSPLDEAEVYGPDTLYEKINGRAPAYMEFRFRRLTFRSFGLADDSGAYVDAYFYDMGEPVNAFGIFSMERDPAGSVLDFADDGYRSEMGIFLRQGPAYVQILASDPSPSVMDGADRLARAVAAAVPSDSAGLEGRRLLPADNQMPGTLAYIAQNAYGQGFLRNVFEAKYDRPTGPVSFFVTRFADETTAEAAFTEWRDFVKRFGTLREELPAGPAFLFVGDSFGAPLVVYRRGPELGGVTQAPDADAARAFVVEHLEATRP